MLVDHRSHHHTFLSLASARVGGQLDSLSASVVYSFRIDPGLKLTLPDVYLSPFCVKLEPATNRICNYLLGLLSCFKASIFFDGWVADGLGAAQILSRIGSHIRFESGDRLQVVVR